MPGQLAGLQKAAMQEFGVHILRRTW